MAIVYGTNNSETINASDGVTNSADTIYGYGGNDSIFGLGGNDLILGGAGADTIDGGAGIDAALYTDSTEAVFVSLTTGKGDGGTAESDTLSGIENLYGSSYDDTLAGNGGNNALSGMQGNDFLKGGGGSDSLSGGSGDDTLLGGSGADTMYGGDGIDTLSYAGSSAGVNVYLYSLSSSGGDAEGDTFSGIENVTGSSYDDDLYGDNGANVLTGGDGNDALKGFGGDDILDGGDDDDVLYGMDGNDALSGQFGNDILYGGDGDDDLLGLNGDDILYGGAGNDWLPGGFGQDMMYGGPGDDRYAANDSGDMVFELAGEGTDRVRTTMSNYILQAGSEIELLEPVFLDGTQPVNLTGNEFNNTITGNDGDNILDGGAGVDHLIGRDGNDLYMVDDADDAVAENGGLGIDEARTSVTWTLTEGADVEILRTTNDAGTGAIDLTGNSSGNIVRGNNGNNVINGGNGDDELTGLGGQDQFWFDTPLNAAFNIDVIADFSLADDTIVLENTIFGAFSAGALAAERFVIGTAAQDANDNIIYDVATGALFYDSDGTGAAAAIQFAQLSPALALTHLDFLIV
jgi:serralysin